MNPEAGLRGRVCLVTGASRTLGAVIARTLAGYGARVAVNYHQSQEAAEALCREIVAQGGEAVPVCGNVMDAGDLERLIAEVWDGFGAIDLLVNNVGHFTETPYLDLPLEEFDHILTSNIRATFVGARAAGRRMKERGTGSIINIAATDAFHQTHTAYGLAKAGVIHLTQGLALELAPQVRVNAIAPDLIADNEGMEEEFVRRSVGGTPLGRLVTRQEIAEVACLLSTSAFASVTGQTLVMDGGRTLPRLNFG